MDCRKNAGLSQEALATDSNVDRKHVGEIEKGRKMASIDLMLRLAAGLNIRAGELANKTQDLVASADLRARIARNTPELKVAGEEKCPECRAVYAVQVRRLSAREKGSFKCSYCSRELTRWVGVWAFVYETKVPPPDFLGDPEPHGRSKQGKPKSIRRK